MNIGPMKPWPPVLCMVFAVLLSLVMSVAAQAPAETGHFPGKSWEMWSSPQEAGFAEEGWSKIVKECEASGAASVMVVHDGAILFQYGKTTTRYMCHSVRKSLMSMLIGIHAGKGALDPNLTLDQLGIDDLPPKLTETEKRATVEDLLTARSGIYHPAAYETSSMREKRPERGSHPPGTHWWYNNWDFNALLTIFEKRTGKRFFEAFQREIALPIGMEDFRLRDGYYHREPSQSEHPAYPFQLSARDLARVGVLMANRGRWNGRQVIPEAWVEMSTQPATTIKPWHGFDGYGYLWWIRGAGRDRVYSAQGVGGHSMDVIPNRKLVFVFRPDTYHGKSVKWENRERIVRMVMESQKAEPAPNGNLKPEPEPETGPKPVTLRADYWKQFPLEVRRELPRSMPPSVRDEPVRIELVEGMPVLFTRRPPAMSFDLIPLAEDRFHVSDFGEVGVIQRDGGGKPMRFVFKTDLLLHATALEAAGKQEAAKRERQLAENLFTTP